MTTPTPPEQPEPTGGYPPPPPSQPAGGDPTPPPAAGGAPDAGAYPPPGGYGTQQPGGYSPQQPGAYGAQQPGAYPPAAPPPPPGSYGAGAPPGVGEAVGYGWRGFTRNWLPLVAIALAIFVVQGLLGWVGREFDSVWGRLLWSVVATVVGYVIAVAIYRAALMIVDGRRIEAGALFSGPAVVNYVIASIIAGLVIGVGFLLLIVPGIIAAFLLQFTGFAAVDRYQDGPVAALKHSFDVVKDNVGTVLLFDLAAIGIIIIGAILCGVGLLVAWPVVLIASAFLWRRLSGGQVAALA